MNNLCKKAIAEFIGTFVLVFVACGVAALTGGDIVATSIAFGLTIVAMAYSVGRVSGCHINPAVSLGCLLTKRMSVKDFCIYVISQIVGGLAGAVLFFGICKMGDVHLLGNACNGVVGGTVDFGGIIGTLLTEIVLTCIFVYTILNVTDDKSGNGKIAGIVIGLTLTLVHLVGIRLTGTSVNPARSIATAFADLIYTASTEALAQVWMFIVAPLIGALVAAVIYKAINVEKNNR